MPDYYPLSSGKLWIYVSITFSEPPAIGQTVRELSSLKQNGGEFVATIKERWMGNPPFTYEIIKDRAGVHSRGHLLLPASPNIHDEWDDSSRYPYCSVESLNASIQTPSGLVDHCLKVVATDKNTGSIERFYAPNEGLVYEKYLGEESSWVTFLVRR